MQNAECRVQSAECRVQSAECRVQRQRGVVRVEWGGERTLPQSTPPKPHNLPAPFSSVPRYAESGPLQAAGDRIEATGRPDFTGKIQIPPNNLKYSVVQPFASTSEKGAPCIRIASTNKSGRTVVTSARLAISIRITQYICSRNRTPQFVLTLSGPN
jgi:hypothetical protein